jgi:hypothetical protein
MEGFIQRHRQDVMGVLNGFDRVRFRGTRRLLACVGGMMHFLFRMNVLLKDFKQYVLGATDRIRQTVVAGAEAAGRPVRYLASSSTRKEEVARDLARKEGIAQGLICVLSAVEPCRTFEVCRNPQTRRLELRLRPGKCLHYYHYWMHPDFGFMHARLQTWFPFTVHVCLNGREWLARQMDRAGIAYQRKENCFVDVADGGAAQGLLDQQLRTDWASRLDALIPQINPADRALFAACPVPYYWSADETEWASDILFRSPEALRRLYPRLIHYGMTCLGSRDVLRFLGRKVPAQGGVNGHFQGQVTTDLKQRPEGIRLKHQVNRNSIKMYDKQGSVLRIETTINDARDLKTYRTAEGDPHGPKRWRKMRKGVADLHRRAKVSQACNERYIQSLTGVEASPSVGQILEPLSRPVTWKGRRVRALHPMAGDDAALVRVVAQGDFCLHGFRNRDLRTALYGAAVDLQTKRRHSSAISRKLRLLRGHGLIQKVTGTHRYVLTQQGRMTIPLLLLAAEADAAKLAKAA